MPGGAAFNAKLALAARKDPRMETPGVVNPDSAAVRSARRRVLLFRSVLWLVLTTVALLVFILVLGDVRRKNNALAQVTAHAAVYSERVGKDGTVPLNLEVDLSTFLAGQQVKAFHIEWLSRDDARLLRGSAQSIIVAHTVPLSQTLAPNGRAVVLFTDGKFDVTWMALSQFDAQWEAQQQEVERRAAEARNEPS